jgi:hypothetical protein
MHKQRFFIRHVLIAVVLALFAGLLRLWIAPQLESLPADYASETHYAADIHFRESPTAEWQAYPLTARIVNQTLSASGSVAIIQGDAHWTTEEGVPTYETTGLYGVDRRTRMNLPGYGNLNRTGQFLFSLHLQQTTYTFWDPFYLGPRVATFNSITPVDGLTVYVFDYTATDIDDTAGFTFLPDVPERYHVHSDGQGKLWIEPTSGVVMDFEDQGVSYFVDVSTGERVADLYHWTDRYTPETRAAQMHLASTARLRILALEAWLPAGLLLAGLACLGVGLWKRKA